jgi:chromosome segregation ATPase
MQRSIGVGSLNADKTGSFVRLIRPDSEFRAQISRIHAINLEAFKHFILPTTTHIVIIQHPISLTMSDAESKGKSLPNGKSKQPSKSASEAIAILEEFKALIGKASKHASIYADFGKVLDRISDLELQISDKNNDILTKDAKIAQLNQLTQANLDTYDIRFSKWAKEEKALKQQIANAKTNAAEQSKKALKEQETKYSKDIERLRKEVTAEKRKSSGLEDKLKTAETKEMRLQQELNLAKTTLEEWESMLSILTDLNIEKLSVGTLSLVDLTFCCIN